MTSSSADQSTRPARWSAVDVLALLALVAPWLAAALLPVVGQPQAYHDFADQRVLFGVPHTLNVLSNLPFLAIGALGIGWLRRSRVERSVAIPYFVFFVGTLLTAFGSAWYHADPRDSTLVWDRLPIALGFAGLVAGTLSDRAPSRATVLTIAFSAAALAAVGTWALTGNLLPYMVMQASCVGASLYATAFVPSPFNRARWLYGATALYAGAVACERFDRVIEQFLGGALSGHTLKHLFASAALFVVFAMLKGRARTAA